MRARAGVCVCVCVCVCMCVCVCEIFYGYSNLLKLCTSDFLFVFVLFYFESAMSMLLQHGNIRALQIVTITIIATGHCHFPMLSEHE